MQKEDDRPDEKVIEIRRQMREEMHPKKHLDQQKIRAELALRRAVDARDEQAFIAALAALDIGSESEIGKAHVHRFRQLPPKR